MFDLKGRVAIVTGGNGGIGFGMAKGLAKAGARVVVAARNERQVECRGARAEGAGLRRLRARGRRDRRSRRADDGR